MIRKLVLFGLLAGATGWAAEPPEQMNDPTVATLRRTDEAYKKLHQSFIKKGKDGPVGVLFLGDSITFRWIDAPQIWKEYYGKWQPANFGVGSERIQNVLWRIENGELEWIRPKVVVLLLGTNNTDVNSSEQIAAGMEKLIDTIHAKLPESKILLLGILPRGPRNEKEAEIKDAEKRMRVIQGANERLAQMDDGKGVRYLDFGTKLVVDGKIPMELMPDQVHLSVKGYAIWAEAMRPTIEEMMK